MAIICSEFHSKQTLNCKWLPVAVAQTQVAAHRFVSFFCRSKFTFRCARRRHYIRFTVFTFTFFRTDRRLSSPLSPLPSPSVSVTVDLIFCLIKFSTIKHTLHNTRARAPLKTRIWLTVLKQEKEKRNKKNQIYRALFVWIYRKWKRPFTLWFFYRFAPIWFNVSKDVHYSIQPLTHTRHTTYADTHTADRVHWSLESRPLVHWGTNWTANYCKWFGCCCCYGCCCRYCWLFHFALDCFSFVSLTDWLTMAKKCSSNSIGPNRKVIDCDAAIVFPSIETETKLNVFFWVCFKSGSRDIVAMPNWSTPNW